MFDWIRKDKKTLITAASNTGTIREMNQDNLYLMKKICSNEELKHFTYLKRVKLPILYAISDGMGGGKNGEKASYLALNVLAKIEVKKIYKLSDEELENFLKQKIQIMNDIVYYSDKNVGGIVGSTITIFYADQSRIWVINVGDSPCIQIDETDLEILTCSDNRANQLYHMGIISEEERWIHKTKNQLTQFIGMNPEEVQLSPHIYKMEYPQKSVIYILCSDGLIDGLEFDTIKDITNQKKLCKKENLAEILVKESIKNGSRDNVTAIAIKLEGS